MSRKSNAKHHGVPAEALTCIHQRIHCAATTDTDSVENDQVQIDVDNFLGTLARIALAVAAREQAKLRDDREVGQ
jgi:hypothetical protein